MMSLFGHQRRHLRCLVNTDLFDTVVLLPWMNSTLYTYGNYA